MVLPVIAIVVLSFFLPALTAAYGYVGYNIYLCRTGQGEGGPGRGHFEGNAPGR